MLQEKQELVSKQLKLEKDQLELKSMLLSKSLSVEIHKKKLTKQEQHVRAELEVEMQKLDKIIAEKDHEIKKLKQTKPAPRSAALSAEAQKIYDLACILHYAALKGLKTGTRRFKLEDLVPLGSNHSDLVNNSLQQLCRVLPTWVGLDIKKGYSFVEFSNVALQMPDLKDIIVDHYEGLAIR